MSIPQLVHIADDDDDLGAGAPLLRHVVVSDEDADHTEDRNARVKFLWLFTFKKSTRDEIIIYLLMILVIALGSGNAVARRIMAVPMGPFSFFLSLFNSIFGKSFANLLWGLFAHTYVALYYGILVFRFKFIKGTATAEHLMYPYLGPHVSNEALRNWTLKDWLWSNIPPIKLFIVMGLMDSIGSILGLIATPYISGPMSSLMSQTIVAFSMLCALVILRTKYTYWQIWAVLVVLGGAVLCLFADGSSSDGGLGGSSFFYALVMAGSTFPNALSFTLKEYIFNQKRDLDVFVVNSTSSMFQLLLWPAMIPLTMLFNQTNGAPLGEYIRDGFKCFAGQTNVGVTERDCSAMPWPYLIYVAFNLAFNIVLLILLKKASALQGFMALKAIVPVTVLLFYFEWPLIGRSNVNLWILIGLAVIMVGLVLYRMFSNIQKEHKQYAGCFSVGLPCGKYHKLYYSKPSIVN